MSTHELGMTRRDAVGLLALLPFVPRPAVFPPPTLVPDGCDPCTGGVETCGSWSLAYNLSDDVTESGLWPHTEEIVHAAVLPPETEAMATQLSERVVFVCAPGYDCAPALISEGDVQTPVCVPLSPQKWGRSYLWRPNLRPGGRTSNEVVRRRHFPSAPWSPGRSSGTSTRGSSTRGPRRRPGRRPGREAAPTAWSASAGTRR